MTDKKIFQQLKSLKSITLDDEIKKNHKGILLSQVSNNFTNTDQVNKQGLFSFRNVFSLMSQPLLVVAGIFVFLLGSLVLGSGLYSNSKPNDSLYIARVISEKARLNTTFSQSNRDALALKFASNHAKDIAAILMDPEFNTEENKDQIEKLNASFQSEISKVKNKIDNRGENLDSESKDEKTKDDNDVVSSASSLKDDNGVSIHITEVETSDTITSSDPIVLDSTDSNDSDSTTTNSSSDLAVNLDSLEKDISNSVDSLSDIQDGPEIIAEIEQLFSEGRYNEVILKLEQVGDIVKK